MRLIFIWFLIVLLAPAASASQVGYSGDCADGCATTESWIAANGNEVKTAVDDNDARLDNLGDCTSSPCNLTNGTVAAADMADADHGDVAWSAGVASVQSVGNNAVALSTDTTGNYIATIADSGASEVTVTGSGSEGAAVTLAISSTLTRDSEVAALTTTTTDPVDGSDACDTGDMWLNTSGFTIFFCVNGGTDDWYGVNLTDTP